MKPCENLDWVQRLTPAMALLVIACSEKPGDVSTGDSGPTPQLCAAELAAGAAHSCVRATDGRIWCWGSNASGQVSGADYSKAVPTPRRVDGLPAPAVRLAAGCNNTCAELPDGSLWCWGSDTSGQLGTGTTLPNSGVPVRIEGIQGPFRSLAMNCISEQPLNWELPPIESHYICAVKSDGSTWCWGAGRHGIFGDAQVDAAPSPTPVRVLGLTAAADQVTAGSYHACVRSSGAAMCWGANGMGGVGLPAASEALPPVNVPGLPAVVDIAAGYQNTCSVGGDGSVWCWGSNVIGESGTGQPADPKTVNPAVQVPVPGKALRIVAGLTTCAMLEGGSVFCWGANPYGELGIGKKFKNAPVVNGTSTPMKTSLTVSAVSIASTAGHTCIASDSDEVWCWGYNGSGELGSGAITEFDGIATPVKVAAYCNAQ